MKGVEEKIYKSLKFERKHPHLRNDPPNSMTYPKEYKIVGTSMFIDRTDMVIAWELQTSIRERLEEE